MFKRILVPLDGSARAERAVAVAARIARATGGTLSLIRVIDTSPAALPAATGKPIAVQTVGEDDQKLAESYLRSIADSEALQKLYVKTSTPLGLIAPTILSEAAAQYADLLVLCSHGLTGATRWIMGSVAEKIVRYGSLPVLVLREGGPLPTERQSGDTHPLRVLVPLDGSTSAEKAIAPAVMLAQSLAAPGQPALHLVHINKTIFSSASGGIADGPAVEAPSASLRMTKQYLDTTVSRMRDGSLDSALQTSNLEITASAFVDSDVAQAITGVAEQDEKAKGGRAPGHSDVIAMTTYGDHGPQHWAMGSVTERVLHSTRLPLLIVRPS